MPIRRPRMILDALIAEGLAFTMILTRGGQSFFGERQCNLRHIKRILPELDIAFRQFQEDEYFF